MPTLHSLCDRVAFALQHDILSAESVLSESHSDNSVVVRLNVPEEFRIPYEQYLLSFVQFLEDVGVRANATLQHSAGEVLFSVIPVDDNNALEKIHEALTVYLNLPTIVNPASLMVAHKEIEIQRLSSSILNLNSQLVLAQAFIQQKEMTLQAQNIMLHKKDMAIESREVTIQRKDEMISHLKGEIIVSYAQPVPQQTSAPDPTKDREPILWGLVKLKPWNFLGAADIASWL